MIAGVCALGIACAQSASHAAPPSVHADASPQEIFSALANAEYPLALAPRGHVQLHEGSYHGSAAPNSASELSVHLERERALGDLSADGKTDAAVILRAETSGSGSFSYLAVATQREGSAKPVALVLLGDRVVVKSVQIEAGEVVVQMLAHGPNEAMASPPKLARTQRFVLRDRELVPIQPRQE